MWIKSRLLLLSCGIALGIGVLVTWQLADSRSSIWNRALAANTNLLFTVGHVLERTLESADHAILHSVAVLESAAAAQALTLTEGTAAGYEFNELDPRVLFAASRGTGYGIQLALDNQGRILAASSPPPEQRAFPDREYFKVHRERPDAGFYMGDPFVSTYDGQLSVAMSRRWNLPDGSFGGVVVQTLKISVLNQLFSSFELGPDSGINVIHTDGTIMTRFPYSGEYVGTSLSGTVNFERFRREGEGSFTAVAVSDGVERLFVFRTLDHFPLIVTVAQATHSVLSTWKQTALWLGGATLLLMFACVSLAVSAELRLLAYRRTSTRLRQAEHEWRMVLDSLPVQVAYWDAKLTNRMSNKAHFRWYGKTPEQIRGMHVSELLRDDVYRHVRPYMDAALAGEVQNFEFNLPDATGSVRQTVATYVPDVEGGKVKGFFVVVTDISDRKAAETALVEEKERFRVIVESIKDGVITTDASARIRYLNPAASAMTGWSLSEARGRPIDQVMRILTPEGGKADRVPLAHALRTRRALDKKVENILLDRSGDRLHIENSASPILDDQGTLLGAVVVFHEAGQVRAMANKMTHLAQHDALTGLPNRRRLDQSGRTALTLAATEGRRIAVLYLDLDGFKQVNDAYGHAVGDELLVAVTRRLSARLRGTDALYRQGGDEFIVLMLRVEEADDAEKLAERLIETCRSPVSVGDRELAVTVSIGISFYPDDADDLDSLIREADQAMYAAKHAGRNRYARVSGEAYTVVERA